MPVRAALHRPGGHLSVGPWMADCLRYVPVSARACRSGPAPQPAPVAPQALPRPGQTSALEAAAQGFFWPCADRLACTLLLFLLLKSELSEQAAYALEAVFMPNLLFAEGTVPVLCRHPLRHPVLQPGARRLRSVVLRVQSADAGAACVHTAAPCQCSRSLPGACAGMRKNPLPALPRPTSSSLASRTPRTCRCRRSAMPASGWLPSSTTCSG